MLEFEDKGNFMSGISKINLALYNSPTIQQDHPTPGLPFPFSEKNLVITKSLEIMGGGGKESEVWPIIYGTCDMT